MTTILAAIFVFGVLVTVHEFGHFITAKLTGMRVDEFAIGFGPNIFQKKYGETLYSLRIIPLGGYNNIAGMEPGEEQDERSFMSKPLPFRMLVILAGVIMNFILPVFLFCAIFLINGLDRPVDQPIIGTVIENKVAAQAGMLKGDRIVQIEGVEITSWNGLVETLQKIGDKKPITVVAERDGVKKAYSLNPVFDKNYNRPLIGIMPEFEQYQPGVIEAFTMGATYTKHIMLMMVDGLQKIITGAAPAEVSGPIGIAKIAGEAAAHGMMSLLNLVAILSINLGVINLLPLPALDGGHFVLLILEFFRGKPLGAKAATAVQTVGVAMIISLTVWAVFNDISR